MVTKERLVLLYQETEDSKNREKLFKKIWEGLEREAYEICHYYEKFLKKMANSDVFFDEVVQEAKLCLVRCVDKFDIKRNANISTFYRTCLINHIFDAYKDYIKIHQNELIDTSAFDWIHGSSDEDWEVDIDNKTLYGLFDKHLEKLKYSKPIHKKIFKEYLGFSEDSTLKESFGSLGDKYQLSRMAIKKIVDKYYKLLKISLKDSGDLEKIQEYL